MDTRKANDGARRLLVVEDEESYREALSVGLAREGFVVDAVSTGAEGLRQFAARQPDLVLLDILLPDMSGTEVCRRMVAMARVPIIIVSALDSEVDVVVGLELGAIDYVTKPFRMRELIARIQAVLRRISPPDLEYTLNDPPLSQARNAQAAGGEQSAAAAASDDTEDEEGVTVGPVHMDFHKHEVTARGKRVHLSRREFDLLRLLMSPPGKVRSRDVLIDRVWSGRDLADTRTLDTHIRRLRLKLEQDPANPKLLLTVRGVGFRFIAPGENEPHQNAFAAD